MMGHSCYTLLNKVYLVIQKNSTHQSSSYFVKKNLEKHVILWGFIQWPRTSNNVFKTHMILYLCNAKKNKNIKIWTFVVNLWWYPLKKVGLAKFTSTKVSCSNSITNIIGIIKRTWTWWPWWLHMYKVTKTQHKKFKRQAYKNNIFHKHEANDF